MKTSLTIASFAALTAFQTTTNAASVNLSPATATAGAAMTGTVTGSANNGDAVTIAIDGNTIAGTLTSRKTISRDGTEPRDYADVTLGAASISADGTFAGRQPADYGTTAAGTRQPMSRAVGPG